MTRNPHAPWPPVDARLAVPESGVEVVSGEVVPVSPSDEPHGRRHSKLGALLEAHVVSGWWVAVDMLTRLSARDDQAPDVSVYPSARDRQTGGRQLEALAFEVVNTQRMAEAGRKASRLKARGVRRVFAVDATRARVAEWSDDGAWQRLPADAALQDRLFVLPIPVAELLSAANADDAMARALLAKQNPVLQAALAVQFQAGTDQGHSQGRSTGKQEGRTDTLVGILTARGLTVTESERERLLAGSDEAWAQWVVRALHVASVGELFDTDP